MPVFRSNGVLTFVLFAIALVGQSLLIDYVQQVSGKQFGVFFGIWIAICFVTPVLAYLELRHVKLHNRLFAAEFFVGFSLWCFGWKLVQYFGFVAQPLYDSQYPFLLVGALGTTLWIFLQIASLLARKLLSAILRCPSRKLHPRGKQEEAD